ncbi:hypothetical protein [Cellulomonas sp. URHE0023]|uniref:hypothetical protein n=1 Tax=Cellulomonas sp. URHE0023 TaxID=1380354 RepID=UPI000487995C|nr:hypothetical protein [Cellulomonas sp. URHE0023]
MTSSSNESPADPRVAFLARDRGSITRLVVVLLIGAAALVGPLVSSTSAQLTDETQVDVTFTVPATPTPTP